MITTSNPLLCVASSAKEQALLAWEYHTALVLLFRAHILRDVALRDALDEELDNMKYGEARITLDYAQKARPEVRNHQCT